MFHIDILLSTYREKCVGVGVCAHACVHVTDRERHCHQLLYHASVSIAIIVHKHPTSPPPLMFLSQLQGRMSGPRTRSKLQ